MTTKDIEEFVEEMFDTVYHTGEQPNLNKEWLRTTLTTLTQHHQAEVERARKEAWAIGYAQCEADNNLLPTVNVDYSKLTPTKTDKQPNITSDK